MTDTPTVPKASPRPPDEPPAYRFNPDNLAPSTKAIDLALEYLSANPTIVADGPVAVAFAVVYAIETGGLVIGDPNRDGPE